MEHGIATRQTVRTARRAIRHRHTARTVLPTPVARARPQQPPEDDDVVFIDEDPYVAVTRAAPPVADVEAVEPVLEGSREGYVTGSSLQSTK
jgi:hypothetical protein